MGFLFLSDMLPSEARGSRSRALTHEDSNEAQQLLRVLDDLADEGYTGLIQLAVSGYPL